MELDLIKALKGIRRPDGTPIFQGIDEKAVELLAQAGLQPSMESNALVNASWGLRIKLLHTPEWMRFSLATYLMELADDQDPELELQGRWLKANTNREDGITAIQLFNEAAKRQKAGGGL